MLSVEWQLLREEYIHMTADRSNGMRYPVDIYPQQNLIKVTDRCIMRHLLKHLLLMFTEELVRSSVVCFVKVTTIMMNVRIVNYSLNINSLVEVRLSPEKF